MCAQGASQQGGESISVRLGALASPPQAQLDGFKSRVLRAEAPAQRHLYATEWWALELREAVMTAAVLVLGDECLDQPRASPVGCKELAGSADTAVGAVVLQAVATRGAPCAHLPLCAVEAALALVQIQATSNTAPPAWLVTEGVHHRARLPEHAGPWGLARSARVEASPLLVCIDAAPASALACGSPLTEPEVVLDRAGCSAARLVSAPPSSSGLMRLHFHARGVISNLFIEPQPDMEPPADDEVLLRVRGVGLNFRDVLNVLGEYPGNPGPPGGDTAGCLESISEASASAPDSIRSAVLGVAHAPLASVARAAALLLVRKPTMLGFEQACTLPVTWSTTHVAVERAALRSGQTLIVHAAAGGVGLKAVEYGQWLRVPCIGSAGRPHKHVQLRAVGVEELCSSRDGSAFAAGARQLRGGRAHEVLNSLSLDFIAASFTLLAESGSFEEIGKRNVWASRRHAASAPSTSYCAIALDTNMTHDPAWMHSVLSLLGAHCCVGVVASLPLRGFDMEAQYELAFRTLQSGLSMGKVVIRITARTATGSAGAHLVTGGTGGLGLLTGRWLAQRGACDLILASRSGALAHEAAAEWAVVQASDAAASLQRCDTGEEAHVRRLVAYAPPLTGVWHAAGVLADATLSQQKALSLARAYAPKAAGAWSLHAMTAASGVSAFALFSSVAALLGGAAQANYAAANACLDALSTFLCVYGSAATSVQWGAWAEVGMAARGAAGKRLAAMEAASGFGRIGLAQGLAALEEATRAGGRSVLGVVPVVWSRFLGGGVAAPAFLAAFAPRTTEKTAVLGRTPPEGGSAVSLEAVLETVRRTAGGTVDADAPLMEAGVDSLGAVELRNQLQAAAGGALLSSTLVFDHPTARQLAVFLQPEQSVSLVTALVVEALSLKRARVEINGTSALLPAGASILPTVSRLIACGYDVITQVPAARWDVRAQPALSELIASRVRHGGFVVGAELADNAAFAVSPAEVVAMDPCQRLLLEHGYAALHDASLDRAALGGSLTGVFLGFAGSEFAGVLATSPAGSNVYAATGAASSIAAGRVSYTLGLHGPCVSYDTACSAALVAAHAGVCALQLAECGVSLVAGVTLMLAPGAGMSFAIAGMTSARGRSHTFDARADGYARGEACGGAVLHRGAADSRGLNLQGSAVRQDGRSASLTAPNGRAQEGLLVAALSDGGVEPGMMTLNEAHGTGTALGDPIEAGSLAAAMLTPRGDAPLFVGGVKANIGHAEPAAGMTGLLKLALGLRWGEAAANAQLRVLNPHLGGAVDGVSGALPVQLTALGVCAVGRGGVSSFGYSGTIAHAVLSDEGIAQRTDLPWLLLVYNRRIFPWRDVPSPICPASTALLGWWSHSLLASTSGVNGPIGPVGG